MPFRTEKASEIDEAVLSPLLEQSQDLHADSMVSSRESLDEMVEIGHERRLNDPIDPDEIEAFVSSRNQLLPAFGGKMLAAAGAGTALAALMATRAFAGQPSDIQILQTAASIEVLAVATYKTALTLPFIGGDSANGVVKAFAETTMNQHSQHEQAFNAAIARLNGKPQTNPDPALLKVVNQAKPGLTGPESVVALALELEQGAAETYVANVSALSDSNAKQVTASIMGVEAQHAAILRAVQALLQGNAPQLIAVPPSPLSALPAAAGSVGFPDAFFPTNEARPAIEGALS
jgi:bacterioferritin (cytochrome b1)